MEMLIYGLISGLIFGLIIGHWTTRHRKHRVAIHVVRRIDIQVEDGHAISATAADKMISRLLKNGWELKFVKVLERSDFGFNVMWILVM